MIYAGVGARSTPQAVLDLMRVIAQEKGNTGWTLRSGGAAGADNAFERGARSIQAPMQIYTAQSRIPADYFSIAEKHHPAWGRLNDYVKKLMARNVMILLGTLNDGRVVREVICWTPGGQVVGGTGHTLRVAQTYNIPIRNLWKEWK